MSYIVLARKYRPQNFDEVYAQEHITTILKNAIRTSRIAHAFLFTGPRGVGKTSLARIFAKSLNCVEGPTINPCNVCHNCVEITSGVSNDVIEIDGASNTGVDDIRELQRELLYAPSQSKSKIYIIDEVHMLSKNAFNALLKTLEEPPENVIFVFATTEPHKVIPTIVSRCQRFDFKRIPVDAIVQRLREVLDKENISIDNESLYLIAGKADGGMRDALSMMDQVLSYCAQEVRIEQVREIFGLLPNAVYQSILQSISSKDAKQLIEILHQVFEQGSDIQEFINNLMDFIRLVLLSKLGISCQEINPEEAGIYIDCAKSFEVNTLTYIISVLIQTKADLKSSTNPYLILEVVMLKLAKLEEMEDISKILEFIHNKGLEPTPPTRNTNHNITPEHAQTSINQPKEVTPQVSPQVSQAAKPQTQPAINAAISDNPSDEKSSFALEFSDATVQEHWKQIVDRIKSQELSNGIFLERNATLAGTGINLINIKINTATAYNSLKNSIENLQRMVSAFFTHSIRLALHLELGKEPEQNRTLPTPKQSDINTIQSEHPELKEYIEITGSRPSKY